MLLFEVAESIGVISFAFSGLLISYKERLDILGLFIISFLTALGGGVSRDVLVDRLPYSFTHYLPISLVLLVMAVGLSLKLHKKTSIERNFWYILSDSTGLVFFAISGAMIGYASGLNYFGVIFMALATAIGGGALRDTLLNKIPFFLRSEFYGSMALIIGTFVYILSKFELLNGWTLLLLFGASMTLRLKAYYSKWQLPKI